MRRRPLPTHDSLYLRGTVGSTDGASMTVRHTPGQLVVLSIEAQTAYLRVVTF